MSKRDDTRHLDKLLASVNEDLFGGDELLADLEERGLRVERILLDLVRPDPIQPRRVLPERIYQAYHDNRLTPTQALKQLVRNAQIAARQRGQPFDGLLDLLPDPEQDDEVEDIGTPSPEEQLLHDLVNLAITIRDDGQVNPLTVVDVSSGVTHQFRIETGERRYWATWLLRDFLSGYEGDGMIPCIVIPQDIASPFRQAKENTARSGLSAIALARQAALLLLTIHGYELPSGAVTNDFYRQALDLDLRGKREHTADILTAMGGIGRMRFSQFKSLLNLSDEALELADRHNLEEKKLRYMLNLPVEYHVEVVRQIIDFNLTSKQVKEICESDPTTSNPKIEGVEEEPISRVAIQIIKASRNGDSLTSTDLMRAAINQENDINLARARLLLLKRLADEALQQLPNE